jgi:hypothetical protein
VSLRQLIYHAHRRSIRRWHGYPKHELPCPSSRKSLCQMASREQLLHACASDEVGQVRNCTPGHVLGIGRMQVESRHISSSVAASQYHINCTCRVSCVPFLYYINR